MNIDLALLATAFALALTTIIAAACVDLGWRAVLQTFLVGTLAAVGIFTTVLWLGFMGIVE